MAPTFPTRNKRDGGLSNIKLLCQRGLRLAIRKLEKNSFDVCIRKCRVPVQLAGKYYRPSLRFHVSHVLHVCTGKEVRRVNAPSIITRVTYKVAARNGTNKFLVAETVGQNTFSLRGVKSTVTAFGYCARPFPTPVVCFVDSVPKLLHRRGLFDGAGERDTGAIPFRSVTCIVSVSPDIEMFEVDTRSIVACVTHDPVFWNRAIRKLVSDAMCSLSFLPIDMEETIATGIQLPCPNQTTIVSNSNFAAETIFQ